MKNYKRFLMASTITISDRLIKLFDHNHGKGVSQPVQLFRIVRASGGGRRGGARALTSFVGREEELGLLTRRWERARVGEGQLVPVVGEPGLGKSRQVGWHESRTHSHRDGAQCAGAQTGRLSPFANPGRRGTLRRTFGKSADP
jgi:hypothetical protein